MPCWCRCRPSSWRSRASARSSTPWRGSEKRLNPRLHIAGVVLTMVDRRMTLSQQVEADVRGHFGELVFGTTIPRNVRIAEAPSHGLPVLIYDNACAGSQAYILLASEFIRRRRTAAEAAQQQASTQDVMSQPPKPRGLGRGLSALLGDEDVAATVTPAPPPRQRRAAAPAERARRSPCRSPICAPARTSRARPSRTSTCWSNSVRQFGLLQPILVRPVAGDAEQLRDHRRRAALAGGAEGAAARGAGRRPQPSTISTRCSSPWSRTCSAPTCRRSTRRRAIAA